MSGGSVEEEEPAPPQTPPPSQQTVDGGSNKARPASTWYPAAATPEEEMVAPPPPLPPPPAPLELELELELEQEEQQDAPAAAAAAVAAAPRRSFLGLLPEAVCMHLLEYLVELDSATLLQTSRGSQEAVALALRAWRLMASGPAAWRFLHQAPNLRRFVLLYTGELITDSVLTDAIGDGSVGGQLRSLRLPSLGSPLLRDLIRHLKAGCLPCLGELALGGEHSRTGPVLALADALEARRALGRPPLTRVVGIAKMFPHILQRIWACCPPHLVTYLEATGGPQVAALGRYMLAHAEMAAAAAAAKGEEGAGSEGEESGGGGAQALLLPAVAGAAATGEAFPALRGLKMCGRAHVESLADLDLRNTIHPDLAGVCEALLLGAALGVEEIALSGWSDEKMGSVAPLGRVIGAGKLPRLRGLELWGCQFGHHSEDMRSLVDGLRDAPPPARLRRLCLRDVFLYEEEVRRLAGAIRAGGGALRHLEEVEWPYHGRSEGAILDALTSVAVVPGGVGVGVGVGGGLGVAAPAARAPCTRTLRVLRFYGSHVAKPRASALLLSLGHGAFPKVERLTLDGRWMDAEVMQQLGKALVALAAAGTPCPLEDLRLHGRMFPLAWLDELTEAWRVGGLPRLVRLSVQGGHTGPDRAAFLEGAWAALGGRVPLEYLELHVGFLPDALSASLAKAAADPAFCPVLRRLCCDSPGLRNVRDAFESGRWRARIAAAEAAEMEVEMEVVA